MQANWSLVLNALLLIGVFIAIARMMKVRRRHIEILNYQPSIGIPESRVQDDIIAVRKINQDFDEEAMNFVATAELLPDETTVTQPREAKPRANNEPIASLMMFLLAKENRQLAGYELLQTLLAVGLRFGEGNIFHRHQSPNGQGPVLCSLAAATETGVFDLQNIGGFSVHGLCLFMQASGNPTIDAERFGIMLDTAKQLSEGLDTYILDDERKPLSQQSIDHYCRMLNLNHTECFKL